MISQELENYYQFHTNIISYLHNFNNNLFSFCAYMSAKWLQSCLTFCDPMNYIPPVSSVHGILQTRILE